MHDIKAIRADPAAFTAGLARRGVGAQAEGLLAVDSAVREVETRLQRVLEQRNAASRNIGAMKAAKNEIGLGLAMRAVAKFKEQLPQLEADAAAQAAVFERALADFPNLPAPDVPDGHDETANEEQKQGVAAVPSFDFAPAEHDTLALRFGYDPDAAAAMAGARFAVLTGPLARLNRALGQFLLDANVAAGWTEVAPPLLVRPHAMFGTGQLPKFADDAFATTDGRYLIPTAEVSLTNLIRGRVLDAGDLPLRFTALTPCFRQEAGSAGRDTRGLIRQHQFDKVELVSIVADAAAAAAELERMTAHAESLLDALGLPYRRMLLCAGDMGFSARKTFDLEVWLPGQGRYREISSVSDCGDFQARRMNLKRPDNEPRGGTYRVAGQKGERFVHTLNGSALAIGRTLVAVIENHQRADGSVAVPGVLAPYMGGVTELTPERDNP